MNNALQKTGLILGIVACITALPAISHAQDTYRVQGLRNRISQDETYRNRFIAGSVFVGILLVAGLYVLAKPNQKGPRPRSG